jgi:hypothetical protein
VKGYFLRATLLLSTLAASTTPAQDIPSLIADLNAARQKVDADLTSGFAVGTLRKQVESEAGTDIVESDIQVFFDAPKYRVHVANSRHQWHPTGARVEAFSLHEEEHAADHIVIFDGEFVYEVEDASTKKIDAAQPAGESQAANNDNNGPAVNGEREPAAGAEPSAKGNVYFDFKQGAVLRNAGYPFNPPLHLWKDTIKLEQITEQKIDGKQVDLQVLASGGMVLNLNQASYTTRYYLFDEFGFDFRRATLTLPEVRKPFRETTLYWEQVGGVHYVTRLAKKDRHVSVNPKLDKLNTRTFEIEFSTVDVNSQIDPRLFSLSSLGLDAGTPFDDHRSNIDGRPARRLWDGERLTP